MVEVEFNYGGVNTIIQYDSKEKIAEAIKKFAKKIEKNVKDLYFLYAGAQLNEELTFEEQANSEDKRRNKMSILVNDTLPNDDDDDKTKGISKLKKLKKSKNIICPKCKEISRIYIKDFKITLNCKKEHKVENLLINEFENSQNIDESKIICQNKNCKNNKSQVHQNKFNYCQNCQINLCPLCTSIHDKTHNIIDYELKDFICQIHNEPFNSFCQKCKKDICLICEKDHKDHSIKSYGTLMPDLNIINNNLKNMKVKIDEYKKKY